MTEDQLWAMSDDELEAAFLEAKASINSPDTQYEEDSTTDDEIPSEGYIDEGEEKEFIDDEDDSSFDEEDAEYPEDKDSALDASTKEDVDSNPKEKDSETEGNTLDEGATDEDETAADGELETEADVQPVIKSFKADGKEYSFTEQEMMEQFPKIFGQAMNYTKKMQAIKPHRKMIDAIEQAGLKQADLNLMIDVLKGDKNAISEIFNRTGVDALDLDIENSRYVANDYGRDDVTLSINEIVDELRQDSEFETTQKVLGSEWDDASWKAIEKNPNTIRLVHQDIKSGAYNEIQPLAEKLKIYDGATKSDLDYYIEAAHRHASEQQQVVGQPKAPVRTVQDVSASTAQAMAKVKARQDAERLERIKAQTARVEKGQKDSAKRKAAATSKTGASSRGGIDYLNASEEDFEEWYKNLQDR